MKYITLQLGESWGEWIKKVFPRGTQKEIPTKHTHQLGKNSKKKDDPGNIWQSDLASRHSSSTRKNSEVKNKALRLSACLKWEALFFFFPVLNLDLDECPLETKCCTFLHHSDISTFTAETLQCLLPVYWVWLTYLLLSGNKLMKSRALWSRCFPKEFSLLEDETGDVVTHVNTLHR